MQPLATMLYAEFVRAAKHYTELPKKEYFVCQGFEPKRGQ